MAPAHDLTGLTFGHLTVLHRVENLGPSAAWMTRCDCGVESVKRARNMRNGQTSSCGCRQGNVPIHGHARHGATSPEYTAWEAMKQRCKATSRHHADYHDRGIQVCAEWAARGGFVPFLAHVGERPSDDHSLDRIDNDKGYEPGNVQWALWPQQVNNRRTVQALQRRIVELEAELRILRG